jgi:hypothetical protein
LKFPPQFANSEQRTQTELTPESETDEYGEQEFFGAGPQLLSDRNEVQQLELMPSACESQAPQQIRIGYVARLMCQFSLPHKPLAHGCNEWLRQNGSLEVRVVNVMGRGVPCGAMPRLVMAWLSDWHVKNPNADIVQFGRSPYRFLHDELGLSEISGGQRGNIATLKREMLKLWTSTVSATLTKPTRGLNAFSQLPLAIDGELWALLGPEQESFFPSWIKLDERFLEDVLAHHVPVNRRALASLSRWPLAIDLYLWLAYRFASLQHSTVISWSQLLCQFGSQCAATKQGRYDFRRQIVTQLARVRTVYPQAKAEIDRTGLGIRLHPSATPVPRTIAREWIGR